MQPKPKMDGPSCTDAPTADAVAGNPTTNTNEASLIPRESPDTTVESTSQPKQQPSSASVAGAGSGSNVDAGAGADGEASSPPLSKSQLKKRNRWQKAQEIKQRRKEQSREVKRLKALKDGRDLDAERHQQALNEQNGSGWAIREEKWRQIMKNARIHKSFRVCFDCAFEDQMTYKETNSLSLQLRYTYAKNRRSSMPVFIDVCGLRVGCKAREHMENVDGFPERWVERAFRCHEGGIEEVYGQCTTSGTDDNVGNDRQVIECDNTTNHAVVEKETDHVAVAAARPNLPPNHKFVYLTGDSPNTLTTLDDNTTYIIGGIVDRNRLKFAAIDRAAAINAKIPSLNIQTARLPLDEHINFKGSTRILTCNHVFEILQRYRENGYSDWRGSIMSVLPGRKELEERKDEENNGAENETTGDEKQWGST
jgi:tRNA (guanine9-N1)-methyltransferase